MDDFATALIEAGGLFSGFVSKLAADGLSLDDLDQIDGQLDQLKEFVQREREKIETALEDAGGADVVGDLNKATKVRGSYVEDLEIDGTPGWDHKKKV